MFTLSQITHGLVQPGNVLVLVLALGLVLTLRRRTRRLGTWVMGVATALLVLIMLLPIGAWLLAPLENRFPRPDPMPAAVTGIIVLGGGQDARLTVDRGAVTVNGAAERMIEGVGLMARYPDADVYFTGGLGVPGMTEADVARAFFEIMGADMARIRFERGARNTHENAVLLYDLVKPEPGQTWLLVTSASHMTRSVASFRKAGWQVTAFPVDYQTPQTGDWRVGFSLAGHLRGLDAALREYVGLVAYWALGRIDDPWPAPEAPTD